MPKTFTRQGTWEHDLRRQVSLCLPCPSKAGVLNGVALGTVVLAIVLGFVWM